MTLITVEPRSTQENLALVSLEPVLLRVSLDKEAIFLQSVGAILGLHGGELGEGATV